VTHPGLARSFPQITRRRFRLQTFAEFVDLTESGH
jgi:hypothetical protein